MPLLSPLMPILFLLIQILVSDTDFLAFAVDFDAYHMMPMLLFLYCIYTFNVISLLQFSILLLLMPARYHKIGAGRVPLCGLNTASPLPGSAVLDPVDRNPIPKSDSDSESARSRA